MSLGAALAIAGSGIANIDARLAVVSQNIANASTPGYSAEVVGQISQTAAGRGDGVRTLPATRTTDAVLKAQGLQQAALVAELSTRQSALQSIDQVQGTPGQGTDLGSLLGALGDRFSTLLNQPDNQTAQRAVVGAASTLASAINTRSDAYTTQRAAAQTGLVANAATANQALRQIGSLSDRIMTQKAAQQSTADLENQRDAAVNTLSALLRIRTLESPAGDMMVITPSGLALPTRAADGPFAVANAAVSPQSASLPGVMLSGQDVTGQVQGGEMGANLALRDTTLPTYQAELDEFSQTLATRFDAQGLTLFTDPTGALPASGGVPVQAGYAGFAAVIQVNPAVSANASLVRDGTPTVAGTFTPNPPGGPAGFSDLIGRVLSFAMGSEAQTGVPQPAPNTTGLGPNGTLQAPFGPPAALSDFASALVGSQAQDSAAIAAETKTEQAVQASLTAKLSAATGVSMDQEMGTVVALQNAYGVNARIISAVQSMWNQLLATVQ